MRRLFDYFGSLSIIKQLLDAGDDLYGYE